ncbi:MAG: hypothetical protein ACOCS6_00500, partial [Desulfosalsimonas sp.]
MPTAVDGANKKIITIAVRDLPALIVLLQPAAKPVAVFSAVWEGREDFLLDIQTFVLYRCFNQEQAVQSIP